ncbi:molybdenum cofactor guanylyltransferase [Natrialba sp. PRR66]|uniref:molybdenum cofactor guanylyltransferase n=1 Tax=Natrialba sp. PRR66 TaxID=3098146 RepID=UPI002B1D7496|nr:molybdenum cofactor guanylyltransferase [Natrialba sp. PRR66]
MSPATGSGGTAQPDATPNERTAVILAGGHSTRFGDEDKAVAELAGTPMIRRVVDRLGPVVDEFIINCRDDQVPVIDDALTADAGDSDGAGEPPVSFAVDPVPDRGPMAGIMTGLRAARTEFSAVVACDMPFVDPELVSHLFDRAASEDADAAVPRLEDEWFQTTQAVYRTEPMGEACQRAVDRGDRRVVEPLFDLDYVVVETDEIRDYTDLETFENINTPEEFEAARDRLADSA